MASGIYLGHDANQVLISHRTTPCRGIWFGLAVLLNTFLLVLYGSHRQGVDSQPSSPLASALTPVVAFHRIHRPYPAIMKVLIPFISVFQWRHRSWPFLLRGGGSDRALP